MVNKAEEWANRVADAEAHAQRVYNDEVARLERQINVTDDREAREVKHVEHQVELDAKFAGWHLRHLEHVIEREADRVGRAYDRLATKQQNGASPEALERAAKHAVAVETRADQHIADVASYVIYDIERDAKAAARHVVAGANRLDIDEEDLGEDVNVDAERVVAALQNVANKVDSE